MMLQVISSVHISGKYSCRKPRLENAGVARRVCWNGLLISCRLPLASIHGITLPSSMVLPVERPVLSLAHLLSLRLGRVHRPVFLSAQL